MDADKSLNHRAKNIFRQKIWWASFGLGIVLVAVISAYIMIARPSPASQRLASRQTTQTPPKIKPLVLPTSPSVPSTTPTPTKEPITPPIPTSPPPSPVSKPSAQIDIKPIVQQSLPVVGINFNPAPIGLSFIPRANSQTSLLKSVFPLAHAQNASLYDPVLYYIKTKDGSPQIFRYNLVTNEEIRLTNDQAPKRQLVASPIYQTIAFVNTKDDFITKDGFLTHVVPVTKIFHFANEAEITLENFIPYSFSPDGTKLFGLKSSLPSGTYPPFENEKSKIYPASFSIYDTQNNAYIEVGSNSDFLAVGTWEGNDALILLKNSPPDPFSQKPPYRKMARFSINDQRLTDLTIDNLKYPSQPIYYEKILYYLHTDQLSSTSIDTIQGLNLQDNTRLSFDIENVYDFIPSSSSIYATLKSWSGENRLVLVKVIENEKPQIITNLPNMSPRILGWVDEIKLLVSMTPAYPLTREGAKLLHNQVFIYDVVTGDNKMIIENDLIQ